MFFKAHQPPGYILSIILACFCLSGFSNDPLPSWNDGASKDKILDYVAAVTKSGGADYIIPADRIAVFDNDGTLWVEKPFYSQIFFAVDRVEDLKKDSPELVKNPAYLALREGRIDDALTKHSKELLSLIMASHGNIDTEKFGDAVADWIKTARHPFLHKPYKQLTYLPMQELIDLFQDHHFKTYIVSGGGAGFIRAWSQSYYGIPPEQVIGSSFNTHLVEKDGKINIMREPELFFNDDKQGKPIAIEKVIGKRPVAAFGNSDGDLQMIKYTLSGKYRSLGMIVHHTDKEREFAYDRHSHAGRLDKALDEAATGAWHFIDMKKDWKTVFSK